MSNKNTPKIISFLCKWCSYTGADLAGINRSQYPTAILPIKVMCSSRVDPLHIVNALLAGADGVLVAGCHPGDCHYSKGNYYARRRFATLKTLLESIGCQSERVRLSWVAASEGPRFQEVITEFTEELKKLGRNTAREQVFL